MDQLDFPKQQQTALDMLRDFIILKSITVIEHDDLFFGDANFNDEPDLEMVRYKKEKQIVSNENLDHDIMMQVQKGVFWSINLIDIFRININYFIVELLHGYALNLSPRVLFLLWNHLRRR